MAGVDTEAPVRYSFRRTIFSETWLPRLTAISREDDHPVLTGPRLLCVPSYLVEPGPLRWLAPDHDRVGDVSGDRNLGHA